MKKYFLIAAVALIAMPLFTSCNKPTGDPEKDAEKMKGLIEKQQELSIDVLEKQIKVAEYYAEKGDYKGYKKFKKKFDRYVNKVFDNYKNKHIDEFDDLDKRKEKAFKKLMKIDKNNPYGNPYDYYDY